MFYGCYAYVPPPAPLIVCHGLNYAGLAYAELRADEWCRISPQANCSRDRAYGFTLGPEDRRDGVEKVALEKHGDRKGVNQSCFDCVLRGVTGRE